MYARIEVGIFHNRGNLCNEKSGLQQNPFQIRGYSRIENSRIEVLLYCQITSFKFANSLSTPLPLNRFTKDHFL